MASDLTKAHMEGERRLREYAKRAVAAAWAAQGSYDEETLPNFLRAALPPVQAAKRASVSLTGAYIARSLERQPDSFDIAQIVAGIRNGANPADVYTRPYKRVWRALAEGVAWSSAVGYGLDVAVSSAATDVQLAMREAAMAIERSTPGFFGYERVADAGACEFCQEVDGAYVKGSDGLVMALHNNCGCGLEPLTEPAESTVFLPDGSEIRPYQYGPINDRVAIENHGELGPVLGDPAHNFTSL
jgi:hypothetical protein